MEQSQITEGDIVEVRFLDIYEDSDWTSIDTIRTKRAPSGKLQGHYLNQDNETLRILKMLILTSFKTIEASYILIPIKIITSIRLIEEAEIDDFQRPEEMKQ